MVSASGCLSRWRGRAGRVAVASKNIDRFIAPVTNAGQDMPSRVDPGTLETAFYAAGLRTGEDVVFDHYYVNKNPQPTGEHEVHCDGCDYLPEPQHREYLGYYSTCQEAVRAAKELYHNVDGCYHCSRECHSR